MPWRPPPPEPNCASHAADHRSRYLDARYFSQAVRLLRAPPRAIWTARAVKGIDLIAFRVRRVYEITLPLCRRVRLASRGHWRNRGRADRDRRPDRSDSSLGDRIP